MGQAKLRGSREQRIEEAVERDHQQYLKREADRLERRQQEAEAFEQKRLFNENFVGPLPQPGTFRRHRPMSRVAIASLIGLAMASSFNR